MKATERVKRKRIRVTSPVGEKSRTKQSFTAECDVNYIVAKHKKTGQLTHLQNTQPSWGDFSQVKDLQESIERVRLAREEFAGLSSEIRAAAQNNPLQLLHMLSSEEGTDVLEAAGLNFGQLPTETEEHDEKTDPPKGEPETPPKEVEKNRTDP